MCRISGEYVHANQIFFHAFHAVVTFSSVDTQDLGEAEIATHRAASNVAGKQCIANVTGLLNDELVVWGHQLSPRPQSLHSCPFLPQLGYLVT